MRRVIAPIAAALLVLAIAGPVAADPTVQQSRWTNVYTVTCTDVPDQFAHGVPGWGLYWEPGDTPWLLMGYSYDGGSYVRPLPRGLDGDEKLIGPCGITAAGETWVITDAYFLHR